MRPIRDMSEVRPNTVLYHSAFGFARVRSVANGRVSLDWERLGENLPEQVTAANLRKVYAMCSGDGFFDQAFNRPGELQELLQVDPPTALARLLDDLSGPQRLSDLRDWIVERNLMSSESFDRWWETLQPMLAEDTRFLFDAETMALQRRSESSSPADRLANPLLTPARRLDIALAHREQLGEEGFRAQALDAWRYGGTQVRELALAALRDAPPDRVLQGLTGSGPESVEALIHAIRRGRWLASEVSTATHAALLDRILSACEEGGPLDSEGRLAATLARWGAPNVLPALAGRADSPAGQRLLRSTLDALPPSRAHDLALALHREALAADPFSEGAQWLADEILARAGLAAEALATALDASEPRQAEWFRVDYSPPTLSHDLDTAEELTEEEGFTTVEIEMDFTEPMPVSAVPARTGASILSLGLSLARSLAQHHNADRVVNPSRDSVRLRADGLLEVLPNGEAATSPRPLTEVPTRAGDVYAAAVLLLELLLGRTWPRNVPAHRVIPYLRHVVPSLPPSAVAPLDAALHPVPSARPSSGGAWLVQWQASAKAEESRALAHPQPDSRIRVGYDTHVGRVKVLLTQTNQDSLFIASRGGQSLVIVCDGISTANAGSGDIAASITTQVVGSLWEQARPRLHKANAEERREFLERALRMANQAVCEAALRFAGGSLEGRVPMGTTINAALIHGTEVQLATLGDSRVYLLGAYGASLVSADQNQASERLRSWARGASPFWDPNAFALIGYIGHFNEWTRPEALPPAFSHLMLLPGERLVMCSDGVTDYLGHTHPEVSASVFDAVMSRDVDEAARELINRGNRGGGGDNLTATVTTLA